MTSLPTASPTHPTVTHAQFESGIMTSLPTAASTQSTAARRQSTPSAPTPFAQTHSATSQEQDSPETPAQPHILEGAALELDHDDSRATKRAKNNNNLTSDSAELAEFGLIPESISQASAASQQSTAIVESPVFFAPHNVPLSSNHGLHPGDIIRVGKPEALINLDYLRTRPEEVISIGPKHYLDKERYWLVLKNIGQDVLACYMTSFGDSSPESVRVATTKDDSLGTRGRLADYVQMGAKHCHRGTFEREPLCFDGGETLLHWSGPCVAPVKKGSYVSLMRIETIVIAHLGVQLMGSCTGESFDKFRELQKRHSAQHSLGADEALLRKRKWQKEHPVRSQVRLSICCKYRSVLMVISLRLRPLVSVTYQPPCLVKLVCSVHASQDPKGIRELRTNGPAQRVQKLNARRLRPCVMSLTM
jgi:hypothetical protein